MRIRHTSKDQEGRIFVPLVNRWMLILSVVLVLSFHTSDRLGAAYGLAVSGVMVTSTIMLGLVAHRVWRWPVWVLVPVVLVLLVVDVAFLGANLLKIPSGGWVPLAIGLVMILLMTTWLRGMRLIQRTRSEDEIPLTTFLADVETAAPPRVAGGGVFLTRVDGVTPFSLQKLYHHMPVLHQEVIIVHFELMSRPRVPRSERVSVDDLGQGFYYLHCPIGYLQEPYLPRLLKAANQKGLPTHADRVTYYTRRDIPSSAVHDHRMSGWRKALLFTMLRNAWSPSDRLSVPSEQLVEIGIRLNF
jgi:KUP system potassium uptake protein